ncbi:hypothetical protein [Lysinibacillus irui]|uniref:hypothetical protein n=1 Tax=Lysinibacillus irui TaxID=2998077 RepID=UPI003905C6FB
MHENWALIEADFQREYGLNLEESIDQISWRRFLILILGLSPNSALVNKIAHENKQNENVIENPEDITKQLTKIGW